MKKTNMIWSILLLIVITYSANAQSWSLTGNAGTNSSTNFIGTKDRNPLVFKTNNKIRMTLRADGGLRLTDPGVSPNITHPYLLYGEKSSPGYGLQIKNTSTTNGSAAIFGSIAGPGFAIIGVAGAGGSGTAVMAGVYGESIFGHGIQGYSYTTYGVVANSYQNSGLFAMGASNAYAGYFVGNVFASGGYYAGSDQKLKQDVQELKGALALINKLQPKKYHYRQEGHFKQMRLPQGLQYGLVAQDVEKIAPELVRYTTFDPAMGDKPAIPDAEGKIVEQTATKSVTYEFKALNYMGLIPILVKGMQEQQVQLQSQQEKIESLTAQLDQLIQAHPIPKKAGAASSINLLPKASLKQNAPNPFHQSTIIEFSLPQQVSQAVITITDMNGRLVKTFTTTAKDQGQLVIEGGDLTPGIYYYSLEVAGQVVDTKKMILLR